MRGWREGAGKSGVHGYNMNADGTAVLSEHSDPSGVAVTGLHASVRAVFERSGIVTVAKGKSPVGAAVAAIGAGRPMPTMVLATLQANRAGGPRPVGGSRRGRRQAHDLSQPKVSTPTKVAYFVLN